MSRQPVKKLIFELGAKGRRSHRLSPCDVEQKPLDQLLEPGLLRQELDFPELSEQEAVRHYIGLSQLNHGVDSGFYPLGSCTMKYNPKINETVASYSGFAASHPLAGQELSQGNLELMYKLAELLGEVTGMDSFSLQPAAGAQGELAGLMVIRAYHDHRGDSKRRKILIPDTAHGTNPASAAMAGLEIVEIKSDTEGNVDLEDLSAHLDDQVAGLMLTNPSTLGLFEINIEEIAAMVHEAGGLLYYDGANMNAIMGIVRPGDMGFDVVHLNLHKTFSTPHGGGGPGAGPVGVKAGLEDFLPKPLVCQKEDGSYYLEEDRPLSIGRLRSFYGNFGVLVKAYAYILTMGGEGLKAASQQAVLNANYLRSLLTEFMEAASPRICMHEFVLTAQLQKQAGFSALDIAKRMIDFSIHPPTIYFPLIVKEAMMFEPVETESKESLDEAAAVMRRIIEEGYRDPSVLHNAPMTKAVGRLDDTKAARKPVLVYPPEK